MWSCSFAPRACIAGSALLFLAAASNDRPWVIDGDTVIWHGERIRIANLDAPEIGDRSRCAHERQLGYAAKHYAIQLVKRGANFQIYGYKHVDRFGRTVANMGGLGLGLVR